MFSATIFTMTEKLKPLKRQTIVEAVLVNYGTSTL